MSSLGTCCFFLLALVCQCPKFTESVSAEIFWAPSDLTVPLGQVPAVFQCGGQGSFLLWWIGDDLVVSHKEHIYESRGFSFSVPVTFNNGTKINTLTVTATVENNNTRLRCHATGDPGPVTSENAFLTVAGPPLTPQPAFHVVNATHIEVEWYKPFTFPEFDVRNYTLSIWNTSSASHVFPNQVFTVSEDTEYPIRHYIHNNGNIPDDCVYLNFTLTASSDVGSSSVGFTIGGFAIAPSPIDNKTLHHEVTFSTDITPMLHINFTFPMVCDYHDAHYAVYILDSNRRRIQQTDNELYARDRPQNVEVEVTAGMERNKWYTAVINVTTAVKSTTTEFAFHTYLGMPDKGASIPSITSDTMIIISSAVAGGLFIILFVVTVFLLTGFILRRRKLKRRNRAYQHGIDTEEAVQRAALAMVPNPIYSGNPIYDEIADPKLLKFLRSKDSEPQSRDEGYVEISSQATNMLGATPQPNLESKLVRDKCTTLPEDTYTVMNPAGTLSNQIRSPTEKGSPALAMMYNNETSSSERQLGSATQSNGYLTGLENSASSSTFTSTHNQDELEERYVKGAF